MRVLGIDPGVADTGWAVVESPTPGVHRLLDSGLLKTSPRTALPERLKALHDGTVKLLRAHKPSMLAIEELFFMTAARSVAATSYARAVILLAASQEGCPISEYNPRTVKTSLTGNGNAPKPQMQKMVQATLALAAPPHPDDVADAMAIGLCHLRHARFKAAVIARSA